MHIPDHMLNGSVVPVTALFAAGAVAVSAVLASKSEEKPTVLSFASVSALIFAAQMMNFPILNGTSGHLIGATLAIMLLGIPYGVLSLISVLLIQCLVFADGGISALGANIVHMAVWGALPAIAVQLLSKKQPSLQKPLFRGLLVAGASWLSVVLASFSCSFTLALSGVVQFSAVLPSMIGVHALIGVGEALITLVIVSVFSIDWVKKSSRLTVGLGLLTASVTALLLSPFASQLPTGLEWVAKNYGFLKGSASYFVAPLPDYTLALVGHDMVSTGLAGIIGVALTFGLVFVVGLFLNTPKHITQK